MSSLDGFPVRLVLPELGESVTLVVGVDALAGGGDFNNLDACVGNFLTMVAV